jgi:hypothetical protein
MRGWWLVLLPCEVEMSSIMGLHEHSCGCISLCCIARSFMGFGKRQRIAVFSIC